MIRKSNSSPRMMISIFVLPVMAFEGAVEVFLLLLEVRKARLLDPLAGLGLAGRLRFGAAGRAFDSTDSVFGTGRLGGEGRVSMRLDDGSDSPSTPTAPSSARTTSFRRARFDSSRWPNWMPRPAGASAPCE